MRVNAACGSDAEVVAKLIEVPPAPVRVAVRPELPLSAVLERVALETGLCLRSSCHNQDFRQR
jgi:hypothetical protein